VNLQFFDTSKFSRRIHYKYMHTGMHKYTTNIIIIIIIIIIAVVAAAVFFFSVAGVYDLSPYQIWRVSFRRLRRAPQP
jgi:uncharacterized protein HemY